MRRVVKEEVKELCVKMCNSKTGSEEWKKASDELQKKWKFTAYNLLSLYAICPTIEYNKDNYLLITETKGETKND